VNVDLISTIPSFYLPLDEFYILSDVKRVRIQTDDVATYFICDCLINGEKKKLLIDDYLNNYLSGTWGVDFSKVEAGNRLSTIINQPYPAKVDYLITPLTLNGTVYPVLYIREIGLNIEKRIVEVPADKIIALTPTQIHRLRVDNYTVYYWLEFRACIDCIGEYKIYIEKDIAGEFFDVIAEVVKPFKSLEEFPNPNLLFLRKLTYADKIETVIQLVW
jgi:hypothetical protein